MIDESDFDNILDAPDKVPTIAKFRPKQRVKPQKASLPSRSAAPDPTADIKNQNVVSSTQGKSSESQGRASSVCLGGETIDDLAGSQGGSSFVDKLPQDDEHGNASSRSARAEERFLVPDMWTKPKDQEIITNPATCLPQDVPATVDLDTHNELSNTRIDGNEGMIQELSAEPTFKSRPTVGREKGRGKSVSCAQMDTSEAVAPEMGNFSHSSNEKLADETMNNPPQETAEKHCGTVEQYSNDQEYTYNLRQNSEGEPSESVVEQQENLDVQKGSSMKLRSRGKPPKVWKPQHTSEDQFDEDFEPSVAEQDNDSSDEYTTLAKLKARGKSRNGIEEPQKQKVQKDKSQVSSRGKKRTTRDASTEKPEKLTHRIRRNRMKEVKTLLEKIPSHEISVEERKKLNPAQLRVLQEARERITAKDNPSALHYDRSAQLEDMYADDGTVNYDDTDRTEDNVQNATKLNYHSYMNKQTRAKWSKNDDELFYKALRQFGSDFAMIQQLFPDKTRHQVRQKFKAEERKNPMQVHDAIIHRSQDNLYYKKVIKQLNIENVLPESTETHKEDATENGGSPGNKNTMDEFIDEEGNGSDWMDQEPGLQIPDAQDEEHVPGNAEDLSDVFDWY